MNIPIEKKSPIIWLRRSSRTRKLFLLSIDGLWVALAYFLALWLRLDAFFSDASWWTQYGYLYWQSLPFLIAIRWGCNWVARQYHWSFSHAGLVEAVHLCLAVLVGSCLFALLAHGLDLFAQPPPRSVYVVEANLSLLGFGLLRFLPKYFYIVYCRHYPSQATVDEGLLPTLIYGAGGNAELLIRELLRTRHKYKLIGLIDDAPSKKNIYINGIKVLGNLGDLPKVVERYGVRELLITIPGFSGEPLRKLVDLCGPFNIKYKIVPAYQNVLDKPVVISSALEELKPEDLLDRDPVRFDNKSLAAFYAGRTVMVTGSSGSIGSEICRQLAPFGVTRVVLYDINENEGYFLLTDLRAAYPALEVYFEAGSVQDAGRLAQVMGRYRPSMLFHAAAHKHVPLMEYCPVEALKNNSLGTWLTAKTALETGVERFVLISTDKAVAATNVMGASKRLAEKLLQNIGGRNQMVGLAVRFGNVLGSNGSLLQIIRRQMAKGGPVTVTHPEMTRFFMTIPEAVGLVLAAATLDEGHTFVLEMGKPVNIDKLVRQVISLAGLVPDQDVKIHYTQKRPGEKMHEELLAAGEDFTKASHPGILVVNSPEDSVDSGELIREIKRLAASGDQNAAIKFLKRHVQDYQPQNGDIFEQAVDEEANFDKTES